MLGSVLSQDHSQVHSTAWTHKAEQWLCCSAGADSPAEASSEGAAPHNMEDSTQVSASTHEDTRDVNPSSSLSFLTHPSQDMSSHGGTEAVTDAAQIDTNNMTSSSITACRSNATIDEVSPHEDSSDAGAVPSQAQEPQEITITKMDMPSGSRTALAKPSQVSSSLAEAKPMPCQCMSGREFVTPAYVSAFSCSQRASALSVLEEAEFWPHSSTAKPALPALWILPSNPGSTIGCKAAKQAHTKWLKPQRWLWSHQPLCMGL